MELDGRAAQGGQRAAGDLAQRQRQRRLDVSRSTSTATGGPIDAAWAASRDRNERLVEIKQIKGQSETHPLLSPNDEFANYEIYQALLGLPADVGRIDHIHGSYARQALKDGIAMQDTRGYNPYKFGMAGGSDSHNTGSPLPPGQLLRRSRAMPTARVERRMAGVTDRRARWTCAWKTPAG